MTPASLIQNYLLLHLPREFPGLDLWRANVVAAKAGKHFVRAGEPGQADLTGVWGGRCRCGFLPIKHQDDGVEWLRHKPVPVGRSVWLEIKYGHDRQSQAQRDFAHRVQRLGAIYAICAIKKENTVDQIRILLEKPLTPAVHPAEVAEFVKGLRGAL